MGLHSPSKESVKNQKPLRYALRGNAIFSVICAITLIVECQMIARLIGIGHADLYLALGIGLGLFAARLVCLSLGSAISTLQALIVSISDALWVVGSIAILMVFSADLTMTGIFIIAAIAICVAVFGALQARGIQRIYQQDGNPDQYCLCLRVETDAEPGYLWRIVGDLAGIKRYADTLQRADVVAGKPNSVGAIRRCQDTNGKQWREVCTQRIENQLLELRFVCEDEGFPFPMKAMQGSWTLTAKPKSGTTIDINWAMTPKSPSLMFIFLPLMATKIAKEFPLIIAKMEADAQRLKEGRPLEEWATQSPRTLAAGFC
jgi:hypothetical protein